MSVPPEKSNGQPEAKPPEPAAPTPTPAPRRKRRFGKRLIFIILAIIILPLAIYFGLRYYLYARVHESTDDAFLEAHVVSISSRVPGRVRQVLVDDNQRVDSRALLVELDPRDFQARVDQAQASLFSAKTRYQAAQTSVELTRVTTSASLEQARAGVQQSQAGVKAAQAGVEAARSNVEQSSASVSAARANLAQSIAQTSAAEAERVRTAADLARFEQLIRTRTISQQQLEQGRAAAQSALAELQAAITKAEASQAQITQAIAAYRAAQDAMVQAETAVTEAQARVRTALAQLSSAQTAPQQVAVSQAQAEIAAADIEQQKAALEQAQLQLSYTTIRAPTTGTVARRTVEPGAYVQVGQALLALVPEQVWVVANFKETQLTYMRPGQSAEVSVDAYPGKVFRAHVDSIQPGTGARFSLLPPENATGNFVKVVQRVPVKIVFDEPPDPRYILAPGMSVEPSVNVR